MDLALFGGRGGFGPDGVIQIELLEPRSADLTDPRTRQHAHANDRGGTLIRGRVECGGKPDKLFGAQKPLAGIFDTPVEALCRIVRAPFPFHGEREHLAQHLAHSIGADWRWFVPLQLAGPIIGA